MRIHLISTGGAVMHNMAMALHQSGHKVTGSDDEIFEPAKSRLAKYGLLPDKIGWDVNKITPDLDFVILGMHAKADNPELLKAQELGLKIYSFPEYVYEHTKSKTRIVIGGSHGKTSTTAMIMHVLIKLNMEFDYLVGAQLDGFETMVKLSDAPIVIIEGDEYLTSTLDRRPKFHLYHPQIAMLTGIAWDHINVFTTFDNYVDQFRIFISQLPKNAPLAYFSGDENLVKLSGEREDINALPYNTPEYVIEDGVTSIVHDGKKYPLQIFGEHNLQNLNGARLVCNQLGISDNDFYTAMQSFGGAAKRMQLADETEDCLVYRDFAHSPSKLKATLAAVKQQYPDRKLVACFELHTYSSLSREFLSEYKGCMDPADEAIVYYNAHVFEIKRMPMLDADEVKQAFGGNVEIINDTAILSKRLNSIMWKSTNLLLMSSGTFDGLEFKLPR